MNPYILNQNRLLKEHEATLSFKVFLNLSVLKRVFGALLASFFTISVHAESVTFVVGAAGGQADYKGDFRNGFIEFLPNQRLKESVEVSEFYIGLKTSDHFSIEFGYADFGSGQKMYVLDPDIRFGEAPLNVEIVNLNRIYFGGVVEYPFGDRLSVLGLVGYSRFDLERTWTTGIEIRQREYKTDHDEDGVYYGVGLKYQLIDHLAARLQWTISDATDFTLGIARLSLEVSF